LSRDSSTSGGSSWGSYNTYSSITSNKYDNSKTSLKEKYKEEFNQYHKTDAKWILSQFSPKGPKGTGQNIMTAIPDAIVKQWYYDDILAPAAAKADINGEAWTTIKQNLPMSVSNNSNVPEPLIGDYILDFGKNNKKVMSLLNR